MRTGVKIFLFLALLLSVQQGRAQTFDEVKKKAESGDTEAMVKLHEYYLIGIGTESNEDSSMKWIRRASEKGHAGAMLLLGITLTSKIYDAKAFPEGVKWLVEAGKGNQRLAYMKLYQIYLSKATGTEADKFYNTSKAWRCIYLADSLGEKNATMTCAEDLLAGKIVPKNDSLAVTYFRKAAEVYKLPKGQIRLGDMYYLGKVTGKKEPFLAFDWYLAAYKNPISTVDDTADADVAMHKVDQAVKRTHNLMMQGNFFLPPGSFEYKLRRP